MKKLSTDSKKPRPTIGTAKKSGGVREFAAAPVSAESVEEWLLDQIQALTGRRPQPGQLVKDVVNWPPTVLLRRVNDKYFPRSGGFGSIEESETIGSFAQDIADAVSGSN